METHEGVVNLIQIVIVNKWLLLTGVFGVATSVALGT
jgi:hypothetical protein